MDADQLRAIANLAEALEEQHALSQGWCYFRLHDDTGEPYDFVLNSDPDGTWRLVEGQ